MLEIANCDYEVVETHRLKCKAINQTCLIAQVFLFAVERLSVRDRAVVIEFQYPPVTLFRLVAVAHDGLRVLPFINVGVVPNA